MIIESDEDEEPKTKRKVAEKWNEITDTLFFTSFIRRYSSEKKLKEKIIKFREDELHHKDIAYKEGATKKGMYSILDKLIKTGSKIAINISEKI